MATSHNSTARVQVTNNFAHAADITIYHNYDTSPTESHTFQGVLPGTTSDPDMTVSFSVGLTHWGHDNWAADVTVQDGAEKGKYISDHGAATMHSGDVGTILTFKIGPAGFNADVSQNHAALTWATHP
jgi:Up-Regulated in long-lived daf-2